MLVLCSTHIILGMSELTDAISSEDLNPECSPFADEGENIDNAQASQCIGATILPLALLVL